MIYRTFLDFGQAASSPEEAEAIKFLGLILPGEGYRGIRLGWVPKGQTEEKIYSRLVADNETLVRWSLREASRHTTFFSAASFMKLGSRLNGKDDASLANVLARQCFSGEADVGRDDYPTLDHAVAALHAACDRLKLPKPIVSCSGTGLHYFFPISAPVTDMRKWYRYACGLLAALRGTGFAADANCATDAARAPRLPGTFNHKRGEKRSVFVIDWGDGPAPLKSFDQFLGMAGESRYGGLGFQRAAFVTPEWASVVLASSPLHGLPGSTSTDGGPWQIQRGFFEGVGRCTPSL